MAFVLRMKIRHPLVVLLVLLPKGKHQGNPPSRRRGPTRNPKGDECPLLANEGRLLRVHSRYRHAAFR
jgi:hypothetical protein